MAIMKETNTDPHASEDTIPGESRLLLRLIRRKPNNGNTGTSINSSILTILTGSRH
jgi:hypothetical protein